MTTAASITPSSTSNFVQAPPTILPTIVPITTAFNAPTQCGDNHVSIIERSAFQIWNNEPVPVLNSTVSDCYPTEFLSSYISSGPTGLPFSPLACPNWYQTILSQAIGNATYIACCPSGYLLALPSTKLPNRPAYGGTCYSDISTVTVTVYDNSTIVATSLWGQGVTSAQAYGHPMDGFLPPQAVLAPFPNANSSSFNTTIPQPSFPPSPNHLSGGSIAGIVIGVITTIALLICLAIFFCLRRARRSLKKSADLEEKSEQPGWHVTELTSGDTHDASSELPGPEPERFEMKG
ncbi:MAG: hypothetical protein M1829_000016 [Trizodia sp. TS-e1964]|nr:MAG: hypothetical protein M1829_000016 [Trizodia sp. TS-e1964]